MARRTRRSLDDLPSVEVSIPGYEVAGALFLRSRRHLVILHTITTGADLGPFRPVRTNFIENEADMTIVPIGPETKVVYLEEES